MKRVDLRKSVKIAVKLIAVVKQAKAVAKDINIELLAPMKYWATAGKISSEWVNVKLLEIEEAVKQRPI